MTMQIVVVKKVPEAGLVQSLLPCAPKHNNITTWPLQSYCTSH